MIMVFTGNGKGKTTASLGQMVRACGRGKRALMIQFIKGPWRSGEDEFVERVKRQASSIKREGRDDLLKGLENFYDLEIKKMGKGFVGILGDKLPREEHEKAAADALEYFKKELVGGNWYLIILDEVNVAVSLNLISVQDVLETLKDVPEDKLVLLTGRGAPQEFIDRADLATEMRELKHPFASGEKAKIAVEF